MKKSLILLGIVCFAVFVWGSPARADSGARKGHIGAELVLWWPTLEGNASFNTSLIPGTNLNLQDIMALQSTRTDVEFGLWVSPISRFKLSLYWFLDRRTGTRVLTQPIIVGGEAFEVGGEVDSELEIQRWKFMAEINILNNDLGRVALGIGVVYIDAIANISGFAMGGLAESRGGRIQLPLPVIGGGAELHIPKLFGLGLFVEGCGMGLSYANVKGSYVDIRGGVNMKTRYVYGQSGYQYINMSAKAFDVVDVGMLLQGPFVSIGAKF